MNRGEFIVAATFDVALAFEVDNHRALLCLEGVVSARADEALNDVIKRVVVVVEQDNVPFIVKQDVRQDVFLGQGVRTANTEHRGILSCRKDSRSYLPIRAWCPELREFELERHEDVLN